MSMPTQCFLSYAHHDHKGFDRLAAHLRHCAYLFGFKIWHDRRIRPGFYWNEIVENEIANSQIFILLTTNDFLGSDYIIKHELPAILERHKFHSALVVPVIYQLCGWRAFFGAYIQTVPMTDAGKLLPVRSWKDPEQALATAVEAISQAIEEWFGMSPVSPLAWKVRS
jgi:hypothetical protein